MAVSELADASVVTAWDAVSAAYQDRYRISPEEIHLGPMLPSPAELGIRLDVAGKAVLDFGCGGGQNAIACSLAGAAKVVGLDPSRQQIELARGLAETHGAAVEFRVLDDDGLDGPRSEFDVILSVYAMQFVADIAPVLRGLAARLRVGGLLLISVDHPMRLSGEWRDAGFVVDDYYARGWQTWPFDFPEADLKVQMRRFRRSTQEWVNALLAVPLALRGLYEPLPTETPDAFGRRSKYGLDDSRNVFSPEHLRSVPGSLLLLAERDHE